jgi:hypothetical protein
MTARVGWTVVLAGLASACLAVPTRPTADATLPLAVPLTSRAWQTISNPHPYPLANNEAAHLVFDFPSAGSMHYLYTRSPLAALEGSLVVSLRVTASGGAAFQSVDPGDCSTPPSVRPFFWANDNGDGAMDRWWSNPRSVALAAGSATISVPLTPEQWSSVDGRFGNADSQTRAAFENALRHVSRLGLTFGGGCFFGHGVKVHGGRAEFALIEYVVE